MTNNTATTHLPGWLAGLLAVSGGYLYVWPYPTLPNILAELLHLTAGVALAALLIPPLRRKLSAVFGEARLGWALVGAGAGLGVVLLVTGATRPYQPLLYAHIAASLAGLTLLGARRARLRFPANRLAAFSLPLLLVVIVSGASWAVRELPWQNSNRITNPPLSPATMEDEGGGKDGPFFPSSAQTSHGGLIPSNFFLESETCRRCHEDIYNQWTGSAHRFSTFNNQWYRKSIEYLQEIASPRPSKWCAGCHDPALLFTGMMDTPISEQLDRPEAHAGLGCVACHSIVAVKSTTGQGDYTIEYPALHDLAASENPVVRLLHDYLVELNPEPHRRAFLKPFMRQQTAEFCSTCHKVHLDVPVNNYRWIRGFNEYDNWQASGVSGQGARSFYYPPQPMDCADCHMPLVPSNDDGNAGGFVHSHRFPAANTALPTANQDDKQLEATKNFLQSDIVSVDIFALSPAQDTVQSAPELRRELSTTFAVGEEAETAAPGVVAAIAPLTAPLNKVAPVVRRGETVRVDVVVRTRAVGHFFPGGTVDAYDVWLELLATDENERILFWSGRAEEEGRGPVEPGAHFYRSLLIDARGNPINKRNAFHARAAVYVRLIPPGAADTVHFRLRVPESAGKEIRLQARLHYRKFSWWNTQFAYAGQRDPADSSPDVTADYDDGRWVFTGDTSIVSGALKEIPNLPVVTLARDEVTLRVVTRSAPPPQPQTAFEPVDWERWNDYGIGLLLQGDLRGAEQAFLKVTEAAPDNPDGWVNVGRARVQEGNLEGARAVLEKALTLDPLLARAHFFYAKVLRAEGEFDDALGHLRRVAAQYPRDRVVRNQTGRILFLQRKYAEAAREFERTLAIDPENLQAHYNLMLCYNGLGDEDRAREHEQRYLRFKADESAQAVTGPYRRDHPEDNNERQAIHEHVTIPLDKLRGLRLPYPSETPAPKSSGTGN